MMALGYEHFIRRAFEWAYLCNSGSYKEVERSGDPARLANADYYNDNNLINVIIGTSYAIKIFISLIKNNQINSDKILSHDENIQMNTFLGRTLMSKTVSEVGQVINEFKDFCYSINPRIFNGSINN